MLPYDIEAGRARRAFEHCDNAAEEALRLANAPTRARRRRPGAKRAPIDIVVSLYCIFCSIV